MSHQTTEELIRRATDVLHKADGRDRPPNVVRTAKELSAALRKSGRSGDDASVDLFSGIGGFSLGLSKAGWKPSVAVEFMADVADVYAANNPEAVVYNGDARKLPDDAIAEAVGKVGLVCGGPPYEGFSGARAFGGARAIAEQKKDPRRNLVRKAVRIALACAPRAVLFENVPAARNHPTWKAAEKALQEAGYSARTFLLNASDYGVPQHRRRAFLLAVRGDVELSAPPKSGRTRTVRDAIGNLPKPPQRGSGTTTTKGDPLHVAPGMSEGTAARYRRLQPGSEDSSHLIYRLRWDKPANTVRASQRSVHPGQARKLTAREEARLQTIPDDYKFGSVTENRASEMIGDCVPVELGAVWGRHVRKLISSARVPTGKADRDALMKAADAVSGYLGEWRGSDAGTVISEAERLIGKEGLPSNLVKSVKDLERVLRKSGNPGPRSALDLFSGVGGLSLGMSRAGWQPRAALEYLEDVAKVYADNHPGTVMLNANANAVDPAGMRRAVGKVGLVFGGPPCEGFSTARAARGTEELARQRKDPRRELVTKAVKIALSCEPSAILFENVPPARKHPAWQRAVKALEKVGYSADTIVLKASDHGASQLRRRAFLVAVKGSVEITPPPEKKGGTVSSAIGDLPKPPRRSVGNDRDPLHVRTEPTDKIQQMLASLEPGGKNPSTYNSRRLYNDRPSYTVLTGARHVHPTQARYLTAREAARLQGFPDGYKFAGVRETRAYEMLEDCVPVQLAEAWGRHLQTLVKGASKSVTKAAPGDVEKAVSAVAEFLGEWRQDDQVGKAEDEARAMPALRVADPEFIIRRLQAGEPAGVVSTLPHTARIGRDQALVNELKTGKWDTMWAWAVVRQKDPVKVDEFNERSDHWQHVDEYSRGEFSGKEAVFYLPLELVEELDPKVDVGPVRGRRFGPAVVLRASVPATDVSPDALSEWPDDRLASYKQELTDAFPETEGRDRELVLNAAFLLRNELRRRGEDDEFQGELGSAMGSVVKLLPGGAGTTAAVNPSGDGDGEWITLEEALRHVKPICLRDGAVTLVGGLANQGQSNNDVDLLVRGPYDENLEHAVKFRLGRMFPPEISERVQFHGDEMGGPFTNFVKLYDLWLIPKEQLEVKEMAMSKANPLLEYPKTGKHESTLQFHFRGASLHGDFRVKVDDHLIGWTIALQKTGLPDVNDVAQAEKLRARFDPSGSAVNKPLTAGSKLWSTPKSVEPVEWLRIAPKKFEPGTVGATAEEEGVIVEVDRPMVEFGMQQAQFHEYFLTKSRRGFEGRLMFRQLVGDSPRSTPGTEGLTQRGETFWITFLGKSLIPSVLGSHAVKEKTMPPDGQSAMPESLMRVTPAEHRFWKRKGAEARKVRDALVASGFFTEDNVRMVNGEFARVETKSVLSIPAETAEAVGKVESVPYVLSYQWWKGQTVVRAGPSKEEWHLTLDRGNGEVESWALQSDPTEVEEASGVRRDYSGSALLTIEGDVPPGKAFDGDVLNPTKETDSRIKVVGKGKVTLLEDSEQVKKLDFDGGPLEGTWLLSKSSEDLWVLERSGGPGTAKAVESTDGIQRWDPDKKGESDRTELRPPAYYRPMKPSPRPSNEFREIPPILKNFATPAALDTGVLIEPKWNGNRMEIEKWGDEVLMFYEDSWKDQSKAFPGVVKELKKVKGDFALDTELMAVDEDGDPVPRRDLAAYRSKEPPSDDPVRFKVFHALFLPSVGNMTDEPLTKVRRDLTAFFKAHDLKHLEMTPAKLVRSKEQLEDAIVGWAKKVPGSEGAMLKLANSTYSLGGETSSWAKFKTVRVVRCVVYDSDQVKGSPGVYNFECAVGPVSNPKEWTKTVEVKGKQYAPVGRTANAKLDADVGDVLAVEVLELLVDKDAGERRVHWFGPPTVAGKVGGRPMTAAQVESMAYEWELNKQLDSLPELLVNFLPGSIEKAGEERYVLGIVLEPETRDAQNDIYSADEIKQAAWKYLAKWRNRGYMHKIPINDKVDLVENVIVHPEMELKVNGQKIKTGTWLAGFVIRDAAYWNGVKQGKITGLSIGGTAERERER